MKVNEMTDKLGLEPLTGVTGMEKEIKGGYASDLLSDVMGNSKEGQVWITMQTHLNVIAVATLKEHAAVVMVNGNRPPEEVVQKALAEGLPVLCTTEPAFEIIGKIHSLLNY